MFGSSSSAEKSSAIHRNVKETISHTYGDLINSVSEAVYYQFPGLFMKTPVVIVHEQIPSEILDWYKTHVFGQAKQNGQSLTNKPTKTLESPVIQPLTNKHPLESPAVSPIKKPKISPDEREDESKIQDDESILMDFEVAKEAIQDSINLDTNEEEIQSASQFIEDSSVQIFSNDNFVVEEDDEVEKDEPIDEPKDKSIDEPKDAPKDEPKDEPKDNPKDDPKDETKSENFTEVSKPNQENCIENVSLQNTTEEENNQMDTEVNKEPSEELSKLESNQPVDQPLKETFKPKVEDHLQLSEESSNESTNLENSDAVNTETLQDLLSTVLDTKKDDVKAMEIEDQPKQLTDESCQLESNQSMSTQTIEEQSKLEISEQFDLQLSEESTGSISMEEVKEEDDKLDTVTDDKMQNIKNNNYNVFAAIEDENNVLDFE